MRKLRLLLAAMVIGSAIAAPLSTKASTAIVDGNPIEWSSIPELYEATTTIANAVYQLKVTNDTTNLYVLVTGTGLNTKSQFFIDADDNHQTGYHASGFHPASTESTGAEYLIENSSFLSYTGPSTGTGRNTWSWGANGSVTISKNDTAIELAVPLASIGITEGQDIGVAFISNDSPTNRLPSADDYFAVEYVDLDPPSSPSAVSALAVSLSKVQLNWTPSTDANGVAGYDVYRDNVQIGTAATNTWEDNTVLQGSTYAYTVQAFDAAGNRSSASASVSIQLAGVPVSQGNWNDIRNYLVNYTEEANINVQQFASYDAVVLEPKRVTSQLLQQLKTVNPELFAIGYISIGETLPMLTDGNGNRLDIYFLDASGNPLQNPDWHGYYVDARKPAFQDLVLNHWLPDIYAQGFDGVFLDTVDTSAYVNSTLNIDFRASASGMASLIQQMKTNYPSKKVVMNRGYHLLGGSNDVSGSIDGVMLESYTSSWASHTLKNPDGSSVEDYHEFPADSAERIWSDGISRKINTLRFEYNSDGTVKRDSSGQPIKSSTFFHAMPLDYAKDTSPEQKAIMQSAVNHAWDNYFIPSIGVKNLDLAPAYDWLDEVTIPAESSFGNKLDIESMPIPNPSLIDDFATVDHWKSIRGQTDELPAPGADAASLSSVGGAAKFDVVIQGTKAWLNGATLQSKEWLQPVDLTQGFVTLQAKSSSALLGTDKAFEVIFTDYNNDAKAYSLTSALTTDWTTLSLDLVNGGVYYPGWDGAQDGFQANQVKSLQIRLMNTSDNSSSYTGTLWIDNLLANQTLQAPAPLIDDFATNTNQWLSNEGTTGDQAAIHFDSGALRFDMELLGTTAWTNAVSLQSREWFTPVDFTGRTLSFDAKLSSALAGTNKSIQLIFTDKYGSTRGWDISGSLGTSMSTVSITPSLGGSDNLAAGQTTFALDQIRSLRFLAINTASSSATYTGSLWIDNVSAPVN